MYVSYYTLDDEQLREISSMDDETLWDWREEQEEDDDAITTDIDKAWQGLSYILTGSDFSDGSLIGKALFGETVVNEDEYMAITPKESIAAIMEALDAVDIKSKIAEADFAEMNRRDIYPAIWEENDREDVTEYLLDNFLSLKEFYREAQKKHLNVLVLLG